MPDQSHSKRAMLDIPIYGPFNGGALLLGDDDETPPETPVGEPCSLYDFSQESLDAVARARTEEQRKRHKTSPSFSHAECTAEDKGQGQPIDSDSNSDSDSDSDSDYDSDTGMRVVKKPRIALAQSRRR